MALFAQPTADVTVTVAGHSNVTPSPTTLTFTSQNWATAQTVTVTAVEDSDRDDEIVTLSNNPSGAEYDIVDTVSVKLNVADNDNPGVNISKQTLTVGEGNTTGNSYTVALFTLPLANVTVTVAGYSDTDVILTPDPPTLVFTTMNWKTAQTVTVTVTAGEDDDAANDTVTLTHSATSTDSDYNRITIASVAVTVTDNDSPP